MTAETASTFCDRAAGSMEKARAVKAAVAAMISGSSTGLPSALQLAQEAVAFAGSVAGPHLPEARDPVLDSQQLPPSSSATNPRNDPEPSVWV